MQMLTREDVFKKMAAMNGQRPYRAMFSSVFDGVVTDPALMYVPIDDHLVHRGDGVFEAVRFTSKKNYLLAEHLDRLARSAEAVSLKMPYPREKIVEICEAMREMTGLASGMLRIYVSRGPGDFSPNPYSTLGSQLYIVATDFKAPAREKYEQGVSLRISKIGVKPAPYAQIKSCNYLPNVLMKKESVDWGCDYVIAINDQGFLAECPTENVVIVNAAGDLVAPNLDYTLRGTTMLRALEFAREALVTAKAKGAASATGEYRLDAGRVEGLCLREVKIADVNLADFKSAREIMIVGTTNGVLPVTEFDGHKVSTGRPGPIAQFLNMKIEQDLDA